MVDLKGYDIVKAIKETEAKRAKHQMWHDIAQDALLIICALIMMLCLFLLGGGYV